MLYVINTPNYKEKKKKVGMKKKIRFLYNLKAFLYIL